MSHQKKPMRGHFPSAVYDINDENLCFRSNDNFLAGCEKNFGPVDNPIMRHGSRDIGFDPHLGHFTPILTHFGHF